MAVANRRPLKTRNKGWAQGLARMAPRLGLMPNGISAIGVLFAAGGAAAFLNAGSNRWLWLAAAVGIQLRLLANMLDGLVAVEGGRQSATGPLFNELPDRLEDGLLLVAAGYAAGLPALGYGAALLAFATAYIRMTGGALGFEQDFVGPMAKQHRMFVLTVGAVASAAFPGAGIIGWTLWLIVAGAALTCAVRTQRIAVQLKARA